jgi:hypothetical protein
MKSRFQTNPYSFYRGAEMYIISKMVELATLLISSTKVVLALSVLKLPTRVITFPYCVWL